MLDYSDTYVSFTNRSGSVSCYVSDPARSASIQANDDGTQRRLTIAVDIAEPISGDSHLLECRGHPHIGTQLPGPGAFELLDVEVHSTSTRSGDGQAQISVLPAD